MNIRDHLRVIGKSAITVTLSHEYLKSDKELSSLQYYRILRWIRAATFYSNSERNRLRPPFIRRSYKRALTLEALSNNL